MPRHQQHIHIYISVKERCCFWKPFLRVCTIPIQFAQFHYKKFDLKSNTKDAIFERKHLRLYRKGLLFSISSKFNRNWSYNLELKHCDLLFVNFALVAWNLCEVTGKELWSRIRRREKGTEKNGTDKITRDIKQLQDV